MSIFSFGVRIFDLVDFSNKENLFATKCVYYFLLIKKTHSFDVVD